MTTPPSRRSLGFAAALAVVVANIVGTGVFTTLGLQVQETTDGFALLALWAVGGLIALAGALTYGELSAAIRGSGGEYRFLGRIYHPSLGAVAGWVSIGAGFAAPVALAAMALGRYAAPLIGVPPQTLGVVAILAATGVHLLAPAIGGRVQVAVTTLKVLLIAAFIVVGLGQGARTTLSFAPHASSWSVIASGPFALSLDLRIVCLLRIQCRVILPGRSRRRRAQRAACTGHRNVDRHGAVRGAQLGVPADHADRRSRPGKWRSAPLSPDTSSVNRVAA